MYAHCLGGGLKMEKVSFMGVMKESVEKGITNKYKTVNDIITSILCEDGKCRI